MKKIPLLSLLAGLLIFTGCQGEVQKKEPPPQTLAGDKIPAKPDFSLEAGVYEGEQTLELSVPSGTTVHYTTDGSTPNDKSPSYKDPILLKPGKYTYKILAIDKDGQKSPINSRSYQIIRPESKEDKDKEAKSSSGASGSYDLVSNIQGLWATPYNGGTLLFYFQGNTMNSGMLQSEWGGKATFDVLEKGDNGGTLIFKESHHTLEIDAGKPKDNKISAKLHTPEGTVAYGDLVYVSDSTAILQKPEGPDQIRSKIGR